MGQYNKILSSTAHVVYLSAYQISLYFREVEPCLFLVQKQAKNTRFLFGSLLFPLKAEFLSAGPQKFVDVPFQSVYAYVVDSFYSSYFFLDFFSMVLLDFFYGLVGLVGFLFYGLRSRINGHRAGIIKDGQSLLYKHFRLPGYSVADMNVQILEKIYHFSENPVNAPLHRRLRELHWIKELGTAAPYSCNEQVGAISSPSCKHTNVLGIFKKQQR